MVTKKPLNALGRLVLEGITPAQYTQRLVDKCQQLPHDVLAHVTAHILEELSSQSMSAIADRIGPRAKGGRATARLLKEAAAIRYEQWSREAYQLIQSGERDRRNVASLLAQRHGVPASTIRRGIARHRNKTRTS